MDPMSSRRIPGREFAGSNSELSKAPDLSAIADAVQGLLEKLRHSQGLGATAIAKQLGCSRGAIYKALNAS
jgi:hypothetical protein